MSARKTKQKDADRQSPTIPKLEVNKFLQQVEQRAWTDAEKELDNIRQKSDGGQWSRGYVKALEGLLLTFRGNDDKFIYLPRIMMASTPEILTELRNEFAQFSASDIDVDYDSDADGTYGSRCESEFTDAGEIVDRAGNHCESYSRPVYD